jgi:Na+/H+ antiporter NhaA
MSRRKNPAAPLSWTGIVLAFALNLMLVTLGLFFAQSSGIPNQAATPIALGGALVAGIIAGLYVGKRSAMHTFLGGMLSAIALMVFVLPGKWSFALLAGSLCALGGILVEYRSRRH